MEFNELEGICTHHPERLKTCVDGFSTIPKWELLLKFTDLGVSIGKGSVKNVCSSCNFPEKFNLTWEITEQQVVCSSKNLFFCRSPNSLPDRYLKKYFSTKNPAHLEFQQDQKDE
jgi:hypothetical protein